MKKFLSILALILVVSSASFASLNVKDLSSENATVAAADRSEKPKVNERREKRALAAQEKYNQKIEKIKGILAKKEANGDNMTVALILNIISVLILPFGLHNWYLGRTKQALWQTLLVFPLGILILPAIASWIWQIVDLIRLIVNGELPN